MERSDIGRHKQIPRSIPLNLINSDSGCVGPSPNIADLMVSYQTLVEAKKRGRMSFYDYSVKDPQNNDVSMRQFEGKVVIVVNTATGCGFTPHYEDLESMYKKYHEKGLEILDIPCNQFAGQTPGTDEEIHEFCTLHYNTEFPQMKKSDVNGENALELYTFLKSRQPQ